MILSVYFTDINQHDDLGLIVDSQSNEIVYEVEKWIVPEEERIWVKIYSDGLARYGYDVHHDRMHRNAFYTWSSNPEAINSELGLKGTKWELAKWSCAVANGPGECRFSSGILASMALKLAEANQKLLHYGLEQFYSANFRKIEFIDPQEGVELTGDTHVIYNPENRFYDKYIVTKDGKWMSVHALSDFILNRDKMWSLRDWYNKTI